MQFSPVIATVTIISGNAISAGVAGIPNGDEQTACANYYVPEVVYSTAFQQHSLRMANNQTSATN
jgi:hypothetical protein